MARRCVSSSVKHRTSTRTPSCRPNREPSGAATPTHLDAAATRRRVRRRRQTLMKGVGLFVRLLAVTAPPAAYVYGLSGAATPPPQRRSIDGGRRRGGGRSSGSGSAADRRTEAATDRWVVRQDAPPFDEPDEAPAISAEETNILFTQPPWYDDDDEEEQSSEESLRDVEAQIDDHFDRVLQELVCAEELTNTRAPRRVQPWTDQLTPPRPPDAGHQMALGGRREAAGGVAAGRRAGRGAGGGGPCPVPDEEEKRGRWGPAEDAAGSATPARARRRAGAVERAAVADGPRPWLPGLQPPLVLPARQLGLGRLLVVTLRVCVRASRRSRVRGGCRSKPGRS